MKWLLIAGGIIIGAMALLLITGMLLPEKHTASRTAHYRVSPEILWQAITDYEKYPQWRSNVSRVETIPSSNGLPAHREWDRHGNSLPMDTVQSHAPRYLVTRIADPNLAFGGTWTWEISDSPEGCSLRITEDGQVRNPIFRFAARFFFGYSTTIETYLNDLEKKFGE